MTRPETMNAEILGYKTIDGYTLHTTMTGQILIRIHDYSRYTMPVDSTDLIRNLSTENLHSWMKGMLLVL